MKHINKMLKSLLLTGLLTTTISLSAQMTVNGQISASEGYGAPKCLQNNYTQFGDAINGSIIEALQGSELDGAYAKIENGMLYLMFTGNLESNFNKLELFFDYKTGGQNVLTNTNPVIDGNEDVNKLAGMKFDAGFESDFYMTISNGRPAAAQPVQLGAYICETNGDPNGLIDALLNDPQLNNTGGPYPMTSFYPNGAMGVNNSNILGVGGASGQINDPSAVTTGIEIAYPLNKFPGYTTGSAIKICAFINGSQHDYISNQFLCGLGVTQQYNNLQAPSQSSPNYLNGIDLSVIDGDQYFVVTDNTAIETPFSQAEISLMPNPAQNELTLILRTSQQLEAISKVTICQVTGVEVATHNFTTLLGKNEFQLPVNELSSGVYSIKVKNGNQTQVLKFVKL